MIKNCKWCISVFGLSIGASVHAIDFLDMMLFTEEALLSKTDRNSVMILATITAALGFLITWFFIRKILKPLKVKEFKIFIFTLIAYLISIVGGWLIRFLIGSHLIFGWRLPIVYIIVNALLSTLIIALIFSQVSWWRIFKNMISASALSFLATILCAFTYLYILSTNQPKREPDRIREMVKNLPYSEDLLESDFR